jgi:vancomycin resistance protein YoaR
MTEIAARLTRPIRRLGRARTVAVCLSFVLLLAGAAVFARALTLREAVLPGVSVAGVDIGGLSRIDAQAKLRAELGATLDEPVTVAVGERTFVVRPDRLWALDVAATEERAFRAGRESLLTRLGSLGAPFFFEREVQPVLHLQPAERASVSDTLRRLTRRPVDARLGMDGSEPVVTRGRFGTTVEVEGLVDTVRTAGLAGSPWIAAEVERVPPSLTTSEAQATARQTRAAVAAPVAIRFRKEEVGELSPHALARLVRFEQAGGAFRLALDREGLTKLLEPMVKAKTRKPVDASFRVVGERVRVVRAQPGTTLAPARAQAAVLRAALGPGVRRAKVSLTALPAAFSTRDAKALGIRRELTSFTTDMGESSANRIWNVHLLGDYLDGTIVKPGKTFSYNERVGPRTLERGFREGQMIFGGVLIPSIGGGVCQTATTIFNAAFETGLPIKSRINHSFYISHYPVGRDATVSWGGPDLVFKNDLDNAILIKVTYTDATFTVSFYGTKQGRKVVSTTSEPTNYTAPRLQYAVDPSAPAESLRHAEGGGPGFDVNVHRKVYERGKLIREDDFFTRYVPQNPTAIYGPGRKPPGDFFYLPTSG